MAKPELEDGYTQIEHEVLEKLARTSLAPNQWRVLIFIIRKTCGWHKEVDYIANFQIGNATGLCKAVVSRCLKGLSDMQLITRKGKYIGFQKDWEKWQELAEPSTSEPKELPKMRIVRTDGYIGIWHGAVEPEFQSMATKQGYILEHRLIMARMLGRCLEPWEVVHHKGNKYPLGSIEDRQDNREENLELLPSQTEHMPSILAQQRIKQLKVELAELQTTVDDNKSKQNSQPKLAISPSTVAIPSTKVSSPAVAQKIKDTISKDTIQKIGGPSPQGLGAETPASKYFFEKTGRKRWQNLVQKEQFEKAESEVGEAGMKEAIDWALTSGISNIKAIITAAKRNKHGETARRSPESIRRRETGTGGRHDKAPTHEEYIASLPPSQRPSKH